jgi:L-rhamnose mutarotase
MFQGKVKPDCLAEYKTRHQAVWPEMLEALAAAGFVNYSIFLREDGLLIGYFEAADGPAAFAEMSLRDVNTRWQRDMAPYFEIPAGKGPDDCFIFLEEVFNLEDQLQSAAG